MKICIIGSGSWGTALGKLLFENGHDVTIWSRNQDEVESIKTNHELKRYLPGVIIPSGINATTDLEFGIKDTKMIVLAVPSVAVRECSKNISRYLTDQIVVNVAKGLEKGTQKRLSEVMKEELPKGQKIAVLSGPSHAEEVARGLPTVVAVCSDDYEVREVVCSAFMNEYFRVYSNSDLIGVEIGGAVKNVIALCAGISDGLGFGDNAKAGLITRGLAEIIRLGTAMGGKIESFYGLTGIGDLVVTCASKHSRNHRAGEYIGQGLSVSEAVNKVNMVVEGINAAESVRELGKKYNVEMPITEQACKVLFEDKEPKKAVLELMIRDRKKEV